MVVPSARQLAAEATTIGSHSVGGDDAGGGLFLLGWNTAHGDLRVARFVGMHALQGLPLLALALGPVTGGRLAGSTRLRAVLLAAAAWASLTALLLWQALRGRSVVHPDALTWVVASATVVLGGAAGAGLVRHGRRHLLPSTSTLSTAHWSAPRAAARAAARRWASRTGAGVTSRPSTPRGRRRSPPPESMITTGPCASLMGALAELAARGRLRGGVDVRTAALDVWSGEPSRPTLDPRSERAGRRSARDTPALEVGVRLASRRARSPDLVRAASARRAL